MRDDTRAGATGFLVDEALRWQVIGSRLTLGFASLTLLLGAGLTALAAARVRAGLELALVQRGEAVAESAAHRALAPLSRGDRGALARLAASYQAREGLASLRILDESGRERAGFARPRREGDSLLVAAAPVSEPGGPRLGLVEVRMDASGIRAEMRRRAAVLLAVNGLFAGAMLFAGLLSVRRLTADMRRLAGEAARAEELRRSNRELEEFAYVASHDLQAPLRRISGFASLLAERCKGRLDPEAADYLKRILAGTGRMQSLITDLLAYSRAGSRELSVGNVDSGQVLREVLAELEDPIREAGARVSAGPLPVVAADPRELARLLSNLMGNAVKFRAPGRAPVVRVEARREGGEWLFSVADNGIGIEPRYAEEVFKMFRRLHAQSAYPGTGIGLAIARKVVERHGGRIWLRSEPGKGSTFYFTLGIARGAAHAPHTEGPHG